MLFKCESLRGCVYQHHIAIRRARASNRPTMRTHDNQIRISLFPAETSHPLLKDKPVVDRRNEPGSPDMLLGNLSFDELDIQTGMLDLEDSTNGLEGLMQAGLEVENVIQRIGLDAITLTLTLTRAIHVLPFPTERPDNDMRKSHNHVQLQVVHIQLRRIRMYSSSKHAQLSIINSSMSSESNKSMSSS